MRSAACRISDLPTAVEPVKEIIRMRLSASQASTTAPARALGTTLTTPAGTPASSSSLTTAIAVSGVALAGRRTTVQPAARAGAILRVAIAAGKFHGVTRAATPTGRRVTRLRTPPAGASP